MVASTNKKKVHHIAGTGFYPDDDWGLQRNMKESAWNWMPAGNRGLRQPILNKDTYFYDQNDNRIRLKSTLSDDVQNSSLAHGFGQWYPNASRSNVVRHSVNKNLPYYHWSVYGWDGGGKTSTQMNELKAATCAPITNFIGFTFRWDGYGSHWGNRAINVESDANVVRSPTNDSWGGCSLNVYNAQTDKVHSMYVFRHSYKGWDIFQARQDGTGDGNRSDDNIIYWKMASSDQTYVLNNPVFLIGINIQCYNDDRGSSSHTRTLNFWDLNPIFNTSIGPAWDRDGPKMVLPEAYEGALDDMYRRYNRNATVPVRVATG